MALLDSAIEDVDLAMTNYVLAALARDENVLPGGRSDRGRSGVSRCLKRIEQGCSAACNRAVQRLLEPQWRGSEPWASWTPASWRRRQGGSSDRAWVVGGPRALRVSASEIRTSRARTLWRRGCFDRWHEASTGPQRLVLKPLGRWSDGVRWEALGLSLI